MNKSMIPLIIAFILSHSSALADKHEQKNWPKKMRSLMQSYVDLAPYIYNQSAFSAKKNEKKIKARIHKFSKLAHNITDKKAIMPDQDPGLSFVSDSFDQNIKNAKQAFSSNNKEYARFLLQSSAKHCFHCHTRNNLGPEIKFSSSKLNAPWLANSEKAEFYVATRQFDNALNILSKSVGDEAYLKKHSFELDKIARKYLAIAVRIKRDRQLALNFVNRLLAKKSIPRYAREDALQWQKSLKEWNPKKSENFETAKKLVQKARSIQYYPIDNAADIVYLRASTILHDQLMKPLDKQLKSEVMLYLGECYTALNGIGLWTVQDSYFESCIRTTPHSKIASKCYQRIEESIYMGFSGSGGMFLPMDIQKKLRSLKSLAKPTNF